MKLQNLILVGLSFSLVLAWSSLAMSPVSTFRMEILVRTVRYYKYVISCQVFQGFTAKGFP